jgi:hypothetical protein
MKLEHLRVGNVVGFNVHEVGIVTGIQGFVGASDRVAINSRLDIYYPIERIVPIELDPTWFIKLGFQEDSLCGVFRAMNYTVESWPEGYRLRYKGTIIRRVIKYVHTLQNVQHSIDTQDE